MASSLTIDSLKKIQPVYSPKLRKFAELNSSLQEPQDYNIADPEIVNIKLKNLSKNFEKNDFKQLCEGFHIVNSDIETDTLTGLCKGSASLSLRVTDPKVYQNFEVKMLSEGLEIEKTQKKTVQRSKYWEITNVPFKEFRASQTPNPVVDPWVAKVNEQLSSVFGKPRKFTPVRQQRDKSFHAQMQWKNTISSKKQLF